MREKLRKVTPLGYLVVVALLFLDVIGYFFVLFTNEKYSSLRERPELFAAQILVILLAGLFVIIYKGLARRKKWSYWASLVVFILILISLPFSGVNLISIVALITGVLVSLDKQHYIN